MLFSFTDWLIASVGNAHDSNRRNNDVYATQLESQL